MSLETSGSEMMNRSGRHLSIDAMIDAFYGVAENAAAVEEHIAACPSCAQRWQEMAHKRSAHAEVPAELLAAQRRQIYQRLERPEPSRWKMWVPATAAAAVLTAGIFLYGPAMNLRPESRAPENRAGNHVESTVDAQLFTDVYQLEESYEPSAAAPIQALFVADEQNRNNVVEERN